MRTDGKGEMSKREKKSWKAPSVKYVGHAGEVLQGGGGKLSVVANDSGDVRKPTGVEPH